MYPLDERFCVVFLNVGFGGGEEEALLGGVNGGALCVKFRDLGF